MPVPATAGSFRTTLATMNIGDYIACKYTASSGVAGIFSNIGDSLTTAQANEIPTVGSATPSGYFYLIKAASGKLVADRVVQTNISWDALNTAKYIQGMPNLLNSVPTMTSNTTPSGTITTNSHVSGYDGYEAFDGLYYPTYNYWDTTVGASSPAWIMYAFPASINILYYSVKPLNWSSGSNGFPSNFKLQGSNDNGITFTDLDIRTGQTSLNSGGNPIIYSVTNPGSYVSYRLLITAIESTSTGECRVDGICLSVSPLFNIRSLTGGNAYLGTSGTASLTDQNLGAWPTNNEWDTYIVKSNLNGKITAGSDSVWHWSSFYNICQDTPILAINASNCRVTKGVTRSNYCLYTTSNASTNLGFRPVLEYQEYSGESSLYY